MPDERDNENLEREIELLFEAAEREKYVHSRSGETFDAIAGLWFLGEAFESTLAEIARSYIVSSFLLRALELIYQQIRSDYRLPDFSADVLTNQDALEEFLQAVGKLSRHESFVGWLQDSLLPRCSKLLKVHAQSKEDVSRLGNLTDSIQRAAEQYSPGEDGDTWAYDGIFQLSNELLGTSSGSAVSAQSLMPQESPANVSASTYASFIAPQSVEVGGTLGNEVWYSRNEAVKREATNIDAGSLAA